MKKIVAFIIAICLIAALAGCGAGSGAGNARAITRDSSTGFSFASPVAGTTWECRLNGQRFRPCTSPANPTFGTGNFTYEIKADFTVSSSTSTTTSKTSSSSSSSSTSSTSSTTTTPTTTTSTTTSHTSTTGVSCFAHPGSCGYPEPPNVGVNNCSSLKAAGNMTISTAGETVEGLNINGEVAINADNVTLKNDCITTNGGGQLGSRAVTVEQGAKNFTITGSTVNGENNSNKSIEMAIVNDYGESGTLATKDHFYYCGECVHGPWTVNESYVVVNGMSGTSDHYEDWYFSDATIAGTDDVMFNTYMQTAIIFGDTNGGGGGAADNHVTLTHSLVAGGGYMFYPDGNASSKGSSTTNISNNLFGRCISAPVFQSGPGGTVCQNGTDEWGYFPNGGYFGVAAYEFGGIENNTWVNGGVV